MKTRSMLAIAASVALAACGDYGAPDEVVYGVAVYTKPTITGSATGPDFSPYSSYSLDTTITVRKDGRDELDQSLDSPQWSQVRDAIIQEMAQAGYGAAPADATPAPGKVGLKMGVVTTSIDYYYTGGWCDIYYGYYGCYYPPVYAGSYSVGYVILGMMDLQDAPPATDPVFPDLWFTTMYGVVGSSVVVDQPRVIAAVNRAFEQSPYLQTAP